MRPDDRIRQAMVRTALVRTLQLSYAREEGFYRLPPSAPEDDVQARAFRLEGEKVARYDWNTSRVPYTVPIRNANALGR